MKTEINYLGKDCLLIPYPHRDMKHNFMCDHEYDHVEFVIYNRPDSSDLYTVIGWKHCPKIKYCWDKLLYNVWLKGNYSITENLPKDVICPNPNFRYLLAIPV